MSRHVSGKRPDAVIGRLVVLVLARRLDGANCRDVSGRAGQPRQLHAHRPIPGHGRPHMGDGAEGLLVRLDLGEGQPRCIIGADMDILPAPTAFGLACPVACDTVAGAPELAKTREIEVDHVAGRLAFIAPHRPGRLQIASPRKDPPCAAPGSRGRRHARAGSNMRPRQAFTAQGIDPLRDIIRRRTAQSMRTRPAVLQTLSAIMLKPLPTQRAQSGILTHVHSIPPEQC